MAVRPLAESYFRRGETPCRSQLVEILGGLWGLRSYQCPLRSALWSNMVKPHVNDTTCTEYTCVNIAGDRMISMTLPIPNRPLHDHEPKH